MSTPELSWTTAPKDAEAVVLVLHGGREQGTTEASWTQPAVIRMIPFAWAVARAGRRRIAVVRLRYAVRGWNGAAASPLADARWALEQIRERYPDRPIGLLGHSMGGRVALVLAGDPGVTALAGLAPWIKPSDPVTGGAGLNALLMHGTSDRMTDPNATSVMAHHLTRRGVDVTWVPVPGGTHAMLGRARLWHRTSAEFLRGALLDAPVHAQP